MRPRFGAASFFAISGWLGFFINEKLEGYGKSAHPAMDERSYH